MIFRQKQIKIKTINKGQFIGIEDAVIKYSKGSLTKFSYNAICQSAEVLCFYFEKEKAFDKLGSVGALQYIIEYAKLNRNRMEELIRNSLNIEQRIEVTEKKSLKLNFGSIISSMKQKKKQTKIKKKASQIIERKLTTIVFG